MSKSARSSIRTVVITLVLAGLATWAGSAGTASIAGIPILAGAVTGVFILQWIAFIPAYIKQTEKFFDLTGSATYIIVTIAILAAVGNPGLRALLLGGCVIVWAARLVSFLAIRVHRSGRDDRFDEIKPDLPRFLSVWTLQGLWVSLTAMAAWVAITSTRQPPVGWLTWLGLVIWATGLTLEVVADVQQSHFRADSRNQGEFISTGLWSLSRHPNYFGEIVLWVGILLMAVPTFSGWQWVAIISPVFVTLLLTRVSGIPLLEAKAEQRWAGRPDYEQYKATTPVLVPLIGSRSRLTPPRPDQNPHPRDESL